MCSPLVVVITPSETTSILTILAPIADPTLSETAAIQIPSEMTVIQTCLETTATITP